MIDVFVGYDPREASAYHTFCDSVLRRSSAPVRFTPLTPDICGVGQRDGSNTFTYSRFLVPYLMGYQGRAIFADGDMICLADIAALDLQGAFAVACVKHEYTSKVEVKYLGNKNQNYRRKNWSSFMIFDCSHPHCRYLTPDAIKNATGSTLHQFLWCPDDAIAELPAEWNHLVTEQTPNSSAKILHYTLGTPCFTDYARSESADAWRAEFAQVCRPIPQFIEYRK